MMRISYLIIRFILQGRKYMNFLARHSRFQNKTFFKQKSKNTKLHFLELTHKEIDKNGSVFYFQADPDYLNCIQGETWS